MSVKIPDTDTRYYEALVRSTTRMYARRLRVESEDLEQVLRFRVWLALKAYDERRSRATRRSFVFTCLRNQIKDLVKSRIRRDRAGSEVYIEDEAPSEASREVWEGQYLSELPDARLEEVVVLPATISADERQVLALVYVGYSLTEASRLLGVTSKIVGARMASIRVKMDDWRPAEESAEGAEIVQLASEAWALLQAAA